mgnify:CR=1 FL=1
MPAAPLRDPLAPPAPGATEAVRETTCYMCACRCGIRVHLRDGEVRYIEGNPEHPINRGVICAKGSSGIMKQYSPARLTKPLRRKPGSERGAGEFEAISWDEALGMLADRDSGELARDAIEQIARTLLVAGTISDDDTAALSLGDGGRISNSRMSCVALATLRLGESQPRGAPLAKRFTVSRRFSQTSRSRTNPSLRRSAGMTASPACRASAEL